MSAKEHGYNGWKNYETWSVKLWIDNDQGSEQYWNEVAQEVWEESAARDSYPDQTRKDSFLCKFYRCKSRDITLSY